MEAIHEPMEAIHEPVEEGSQYAPPWIQHTAEESARLDALQWNQNYLIFCRGESKIEFTELKDDEDVRTEDLATKMAMYKQTEEFDWVNGFRISEQKPGRIDWMHFIRDPLDNEAHDPGPYWGKLFVHLQDEMSRVETDRVLYPEHYPVRFHIFLQTRVIIIF